MMQRPDAQSLRHAVEFIALRSAQFSEQAGVGSMETAGSAVSYLAENPADIEPFINGGFAELPIGWHTRGCLTWHGMDGKIHSPQEARFAAIIKGLKS